MKQDIHGIVEEPSDTEFAEKVEHELQSRRKLYGTGTLKCESCPRCFLTKWELNMHKRRAHRDGANRTFVKLDDKFPCAICNQVFSTLKFFKKHIYLSHHAVDIRAKYNRSLEGIVGNHMLWLFRKPIFSRIRKGHFEEMAICLLNQRIPFNTEGIDRTMALKHDMDPFSQQKRKSLYTQKRDILLKLAEDKDEVKRLPFYDRPYVERHQEKINISWDLSSDYDFEDTPDDIARCLKYIQQMQ